MVKLALMDFDGTLSRGYISMEFMEYLFKTGFYDKTTYENQMKILGYMKKGSISYETWCERWGELWALGLRGKKKNIIEKCAEEFFENFKKNIYQSSKKLVEFLTEKGYNCIIISVGAEEVIGLASRYIGVGEFFATKLGTRNGIYTGTVRSILHKRNGKEKLIRSILKKYKVSEMIAFGDSTGDIAMLNVANIAVMLNPKEELKEYGKGKVEWYEADYTNVIEVVRKIL